MGRGEAPRARRRPRPCAERARRRVPAFGRCTGGGELGRAGDRARAISREGISASDGGARCRRQPGGGAPGVRAMPPAPRRRARRLPVARDRVGLPRAARTASDAAPAAPASGRRHPQTRTARQEPRRARATSPEDRDRRSRRRSELPWPVAAFVATRGGATHAARSRQNAVGLHRRARGQGERSGPGRPGADVGRGRRRLRLDDERAGGHGLSRSILARRRYGRRSPSAPARAGSPSATAASGSRTTTTTTVSWINPQTNAVVSGRSTSAQGRPPSPTATARSGSPTPTTAP